ncbi:MAG TPA: DNA-binding response regulator [Verrucomicrobia bacterium]|nr:MAG: DNA-binding response regulator [Lentisphaerae bacterium GWF2_57_35]HBA84835.1 DNA-binding response regulator [Verrucomicrobiota bacterium]
MAGETVLIIEDDPALLRGVKDNFESVGYIVHAAADGEKGLNDALRIRPDLILLDLMLPKVNGYEICRALRDNGQEMPIIMLTAKSQESDIVLGLNLGADDYVTKPFSIKELLARSHAFLRRRGTTKSAIRRFGDFELDLDSRKLRRKNVEIELTPKEFELLAFLTEQAGKALTRERILNAVWGHDVFVTSRSVDRCINTLRGKIERSAAYPVFIKTVREIGYRFEMP